VDPSVAEEIARDQDGRQARQPLHRHHRAEPLGIDAVGDEPPARRDLGEWAGADGHVLAHLAQVECVIGDDLARAAVCPEGQTALDPAAERPRSIIPEHAVRDQHRAGVPLDGPVVVRVVGDEDVLGRELVAQAAEAQGHGPEVPAAEPAAQGVGYVANAVGRRAGHWALVDALLVAVGLEHLQQLGEVGVTAAGDWVIAECHVPDAHSVPPGTSRGRGPPTPERPTLVFPWSRPRTCIAPLMSPGSGSPRRTPRGRDAAARGPAPPLPVQPPSSGCYRPPSADRREGAGARSLHARA